MKKILILLLTVVCLTGCQDYSHQQINDNQRYLSLIDNLNSYEQFSTSSNYFDISCEMAKIDDGYRYYVTIDNPTSALYDIEAIAIEKDVDYQKNMAANIGLFDEKEYCLIPNQTNPDKGYVAGVVISGISQLPETSLYVYVCFKSEDHSTSHSEYFKLDVQYQD